MTRFEIIRKLILHSYFEYEFFDVPFEGVEKILRNFNGRIQIREFFHEVTFLDQLYLKIVDSSGKEKSYFLLNKGLIEVDGNELILYKDDAFEVNFNLSEND